MRLEDAFVYLVLDLRDFSIDEAGRASADAISVGADVIQIRWGKQPFRDGELSSADLTKAHEIALTCRRQDALLIIADDPGLVGTLKADGVHLSAGNTQIGLARSAVGANKIVGLSSFSPDEARTSLELEPDYLLHYGGAECFRVLSDLKLGVGIPLFAAGLRSAGEAEKVIRSGVYRLCMECELLKPGEIKEEISKVSRMLGRSV